MFYLLTINKHKRQIKKKKARVYMIHGSTFQKHQSSRYFYIIVCHSLFIPSKTGDHHICQ